MCVCIYIYIYDFCYLLLCLALHSIISLAGTLAGSLLDLAGLRVFEQSVSVTVSCAGFCVGFYCFWCHVSGNDSALVMESVSRLLGPMDTGNERLHKMIQKMGPRIQEKNTLNGPSDPEHQK